MKRIATAIVLMLLLQANAAYPNGGPVAWTELSPFNNLSVKSVHEDSISLQKEDLSIIITGFNTYHVKAEYYLVSDAPQEVTFGVPITGDIGAFSQYGIEGGMFETVEECLAYKRELYSYGKVVGYKTYTEEECKKNVESYAPEFKKYREALNEKTKKLGSTISILLNDSKVSCDTVYPSPYTHQYLSELNFTSKPKAWCVTKSLKLDAKSNRITMEYDGQLDYDDMIFTKSPLVRYSDRKLSYYFSPAGYWRGQVSEVNISLDLGPYTNYSNIVSPEGYTIVGNKVIWNLKDVDLLTLKSLEVTFTPELLQYNELMTWNKSAPNYAKKPTQVKATSTLQTMSNITYAANNVADGKAETAWCEGVKGDGIGEKLTFTLGKDLKQYCSLYGIGIVPGYAKTQKAYVDNGRIKKVRLSSCDTDTSYEFDIPLQAEFYKSAYMIRNFQNDKGYSYNHPDYRALNYITNTGCFILEVLEVEKGKHDDSCISEVSVIINCG